MVKYLYEVRFARGRGNKEFTAFKNNIDSLKGKAPDYSGDGVCFLVSHHMDIDTIRLLCSDGLSKKGDESLTVSEVTRETMYSPDSSHGIFVQLFKNYFSPYGRYPNIE